MILLSRREQETTQRQPGSSAPPLEAPSNPSCKPGHTLEPREYTQPELLQMNLCPPAESLGAA
jgi:hypothetical protein